MTEKETLKCNHVVDAMALDRHPEILKFINNRVDLDVGEALIHRIRDNGEFIVRARIEEEQFKGINALNITGIVEITRLIRCKDCIHRPKGHQYCRMFDMYTVDDFFCSEGERRK